MNDVLNGDDTEGTVLNGASSIGTRAEEGDEAPELFPNGSLEGDEVRPQKLIKPGLPIQVTAAMGQAEVPLQGGLIDPNKAGRALVSYAFAKNIEVPDYEDGRIVGWKIRQMLRPTFVAQANDEVKLIEAEFEALLALRPEAAGELLDRLRSMAAESLQTA